MVVDISVEVFVKGVVLECEDDVVKFDDNLVDIVFGEVVFIVVKGVMKEIKILMRYLGMIQIFLFFICWDFYRVKG